MTYIYILIKEGPLQALQEMRRVMKEDGQADPAGRLGTSSMDCLDSPFTKNNKAALLKEAKRQSRRDR